MPDHPVGSLIPIGHVSGMWFVDRRHGFGVADLRLVRTNDGGRTWRVVGSPIPTDDLGYAPGNAIFTSLSDGYLFGGGLRVTHDGGATWHDPHLNPYLEEGYGPRDAQVLALQPRGANVWALVDCPPQAHCGMELHVSDDGGLAWRKQSTPMLRTDDLSAGLARVSATKAYAVAAVGGDADTENAPYHHLAVTNDGGKTWRYLPDPCHVTLSEFLASAGPNELWLVCGGEPATAMAPKEVFRSSDGGRHWQLRASVTFGSDSHDVGVIPASGHVDDLVAVSPSRAYIGLNRFTQFQTVDGGRTWTNSFPFGAYEGGGPINFVDPTHGWGIGEFHLYQTVDGLHWRDLGGSHP